MHNQFNQFVFYDNSYTSRNIVSHTIVKHIIKITHNLAYIGLEPKSSHKIKYSQPFELVLFHVIKASNECHEDFHYPHLLNNYLNSSGLTFSPPYKIFVLKNLTYQETNAHMTASCDPLSPKSFPG